MILVKEEFVGGEKWRRAVKLGGSDAIVLWVALKNYCSQHPDTEGFVPNEELDGLPGAPRGARRRALDALIACGRLLPDGSRGPGLVEATEAGWQMHDYLDHSPAPEETELRREKARLKKQAFRDSKRRELAAVRRLADDLAGGDTGGTVPGDTGGQSGDTGGDSPGDTGGTVPGDSLAGERPPVSARARARAHPNPTQPNPNLRGLASRIRDARASPGELGHPVEASAELRLYAAENGLELEPFLADLRRAASTSALGPDEIQVRLAALLRAAVERRQAIGGAA